MIRKTIAISIAGFIVGSITAPVVAVAGYGTWLTESQRCQALGISYIRKPGAGVVVDWCDPGDDDKLQSDIYQMLYNGSAGDYLFSYVDIDCEDEKDNIPPDVHSALCTK